MESSFNPILVLFEHTDGTPGFSITLCSFNPILVLFELEKSSSVYKPL